MRFKFVAAALPSVVLLLFFSGTAGATMLRPDGGISLVPVGAETGTQVTMAVGSQSWPGGIPQGGFNFTASDFDKIAGAAVAPAAANPTANKVPEPGFYGILAFGVAILLIAVRYHRNNQTARIE